MAVTRETLRRMARIRADLDRVVDAQTRDLVRAWSDAWSEVATDLRTVLLEMLVAGEGQITRAQVMRSLRLQTALLMVASRLEDLADQAGVRITGDLARVVEMAGAAQASVIDSQLPPGFTSGMDAWTRVDPRQVEAIVRRSTEQITSLTRPLAPEAYQAMRLELIRGVTSGSSPRATARRMLQRAEGRFNGGLTRALVISRTETLDAHRSAARLGQLASENVDVLASWEWVAQLDSRTCPACFSMHGSRHDVTDPGPLGHQQCRCARLPRTKTWRELGFTDIEEPPDLLPDAQATFTSLTGDEQRAILGPKRHEAWVRGDYPMDRWAVRRSNDGWRDAYYVSPAPSGGRASSARVAS